jgi:hypothetical protein
MPYLYNDTVPAAVPFYNQHMNYTVFIKYFSEKNLKSVHYFGLTDKFKSINYSFWKKSFILIQI